MEARNIFDSEGKVPLRSKLGLKVVRKTDGMVRVETSSGKRLIDTIIDRPKLKGSYLTVSVSWQELIRYGLPSSQLPPLISDWRRENRRNLLRKSWKFILAHWMRLPHLSSKLFIVKILGDSGEEIPYGLASLRVVTTAGVNFMVDAFQNLTELENMKYHGIGTGTNAEAVGDVALQTELTTEYNPDNTRATGTLTEGASANIFRTVGTNTLDAGTPSVDEHMILTQAATGGGTGLDRSKFTAIGLTGANGDGLQTTYDLTITAGG